MPPVASIFFLANIMNPSTDSIIIFIPSGEYTHNSRLSSEFPFVCIVQSFVTVTLTCFWTIVYVFEIGNDGTVGNGWIQHPSWLEHVIHFIFVAKKVIILNPFLLVIGTLFGGKNNDAMPMEWSRDVNNNNFHTYKRTVIFCILVSVDVFGQISQATCATFVSVTFTPHIQQQQQPSVGLRSSIILRLSA